MRKRIVIGLLTVSVVGAVVFFVSQPKKGSVEWHRREYLSALKEPWTVRVQSLWNRVRGRDAEVFDAPMVAFDDRLAKHQAELIRLGYLERRELVFSNRTAEAILLGRDFEHVRTNLLKDPRLKRMQWEFVELIPTKGEYSHAIVARRQDISTLEEIFRRGDVQDGRE